MQHSRSRFSFILSLAAALLFSYGAIAPVHADPSDGPGFYGVPDEIQTKLPPETHATGGTSKSSGTLGGKDTGGYRTTTAFSWSALVTVVHAELKAILLQN